MPAALVPSSAWLCAEPLKCPACGNGIPSHGTELAQLAECFAGSVLQALGSGSLWEELFNSRWHQQPTAGSGIGDTGVVPRMCHRNQILAVGRLKITLLTDKLLVVIRINAVTKPRHREDLINSLGNICK